MSIDDRRWRQCHASSIAVAGGVPVLAWFAGSAEGARDSRVYVARDGELRRLDTGRGEPHWNPVLTVAADGSLWLFAKVGPRISGWVTLVTRSADGGASWGPVRELVPGDRSGGRGPVKNPPLLTPDGLWLAPASTEHCDGEGRARWDPFVDVSSDGGASWRRTPIPVEHREVPGAGLIQPALWWGGSGPVALMRSTAGCAFRSTSSDGGRTWTRARPTELPNNNSGLAATVLHTGRVVAVHNPGTESWGSRCPLVVSVSDDDGLGWRAACTLDDGRTPVDPRVPMRLAGAGGGAPPDLVPSDTGVLTGGVDEYSYPSVTLDGDRLLVSYTWQRRGIVLAELSGADLADA